MGDLENRLFEFQQQTIDKISELFSNNSVVVLYGGSSCGKTTIGKLFQLNGYKKHLISGNIDFRFEDLGVFKRSTLFARSRKMKSPIVDIASIVSSFFGKDALVEGVSNLLDFISPSDTEHLIKQLNVGKNLLVIDHLDQFDHNSLLMFKYLESQIESASLKEVKVLIIVNSDSEIFTHSKWSSIQIGRITTKDFFTLGIQRDHQEYQDVPLTILLDQQRNNLDAINIFREKEIKKRLASLETTSEIIVLKTVLLYSTTTKEKWVSIEGIRDFLWQNRIYDAYECMNRLNELHLIEMSEQKKYVCIHEASRLWIENALVKETNSERTFIYLDYLEKNAPFLYYEKYMHYVQIGNNELALKNAILSYSQFMREKDASTITNHLLEYIKSFGGIEIHDFLKQSYTNYINNNYRYSFYLTDNFLKEFAKNPYAFSDEIIAEISYIRGLSLARSINRSKNTRHIQDFDIDYMEQLLNSLKDINLDLFTRIQEVILNLCTDIINTTRTDYKERAKKIFSDLYVTYQKQIAKTSAKHVEFWQVKLAVLLSKINSVISSDQEMNTIPVLRRALLVLSQVKSEYPKYYLRTACNYAGTCYWRGQYREAESVLDEATTFIEANKFTESWGIIYQIKTMIKIIMNNGDNNSFNHYTETIWQNERVRNKMHEEFISISNYSLFLLSINTNASTNKAIEYIQAALDLITAKNKIVDGYDKYLLKTNLGVARYLSGDRQSAILVEKECLPLIENAEINYLDLVQLKERHILLINLYNTDNSGKTSLSLLVDRQEKSFKSGHDQKNYHRLGFFSNIEYWSN